MMSKLSYNLTAIITLFPTEQGGRKRPVYSGYRPNFGFNTQQHYCGEIELLNTKKLVPGGTSQVYIRLLPARTIRKNLKPDDAFVITEGAQPIGAGVIEKVEKEEIHT